MNGTTLKSVSEIEVRFIAEHMREIDRHEYVAQNWFFDPAAITRYVLHAGGLFRVIGDSKPIAVIGVVERHPGMWEATAFATDEFPRIAKTATRYARDVLLPTLRRLGMRRAEARALAINTGTCRWLERVGAEFESVMKNYGTGGEDFVVYRWS